MLLSFRSGPIDHPITTAHACHSSKHTADEAEAGADADAPTTKFEPEPPLVFNPATENNDEDVEDDLDDGASSSSMVF